MALAGPASNLCLVLLAGAGLRAGVAFGWFEVPMRFSSSALAVAAPGAPTLAVTALSLLFSLNLTLGLLNLLPVPPLDGSAVLPLFLPEAWGRRYQEPSRSSPQIALVGMVCGTPAMCARMPAAKFRQTKTRAGFRDPRHGVASARGIDRVVVTRPKKGAPKVIVAGKAVHLAVPSAGVVRVTMALSDTSGARCHAVSQAFRAIGHTGGLKAP
jgi:Zn-dependent protease